MKKLYGALFWIFFCLVCAVSHVSADPRMETNKNFCHFILDPTNTDNEVLAAGCNSTITVRLFPGVFFGFKIIYT